MMRKRSLLGIVLTGFFLLGLFLPAAAGAENGEGEKGFYRPPYLEQIIKYFEDNNPVEKEREEEEKEETKREEIIEHRVKRGETISSIANRYQSSVEVITSSNQIKNPHEIQVGEILTISRGEVLFHQVQEGDTLWDISRRYGAKWEEVVDINGVEDPHKLSLGATLVIPFTGEEGEVSPLLAQEIPAEKAEREDREEGESRDNRDKGPFIWPADGPISSPYGPRKGGFHHGLDIAVPTGTPLRAIASGTVEFSGWRGGYGRAVIIDHGQGWQSLYGHASRLNVREGEWVYQGQIIARAGATGNATGPHLHLEIIEEGKKLNPIKHLPPR
ncbi:MAG: M23 family metallopeptidase [Candidatus Syntrophonatronum acetioxidans]|uniref:M23 family metallopeptidase n=1 Tax=Candidatus Syntrophonatronum acetioxidans TaxID=1795816 RepID=A0A424YFX0_9FIRM|nr:MAG: M23 family metallopeptidase [Candidatus Syntrophonatronum acetioxidans]